MGSERIASGKSPSPDAQVHLVDDDISIRESICALLSSVALPVQAFESADEFLAREMSDLPSCLLLDVRLKGPSGVALQHDIFSGSIPFPVIFLTGHGDIEMSVKAMKAGAFDFMTKPFKEQELIDTVVAALRKDRRLKVSKQSPRSFENFMTC